MRPNANDVPERTSWSYVAAAAPPLDAHAEGLSTIGKMAAASAFFFSIAFVLASFLAQPWCRRRRTQLDRARLDYAWYGTMNVVPA